MNTTLFNFTAFPLFSLENERGTNQWERLVSFVAKQLKKQPVAKQPSFRDLTGYQSVTIEEVAEETAAHVLEYMKRCAGEKKETGNVLRVFIQKGKNRQEAYSLEEASFPSNTHKGLHKIEGQFTRIVDLSILLAETLLLNALEDYARGNEDLIQYLVTRHIARNIAQEHVTPLPLDGKFSFDLIKKMKTYDLYQKETLKTKQVDIYKDIFYLTKNKQGFIQHIEHPLFLDIVVPEFIQDCFRITQNEQRKKAQQHVYATSFQTKKRIKKATQQKMDNNAFLSHFGYVELDNQVALEDFAVWEEAFVQLNALIPIPKALDHSLRIRRLGKQKATGMYYEAFKTTVLDTESPQSFVHELGHQLDVLYRTTKRTISEEIAFRPLLDAYQHITQQQVESLANDVPFKRQWNGKGKYNKLYFFTPTEVFARSFELYLQAKGIVSILLKADLTGAEYPHDRAYIAKVNQYFDALLEKKK